jgi:hypothetical protein
MTVQAHAKADDMGLSSDLGTLERMFVVLVSDELVENSQFRTPDGHTQLTSYPGL